MLNVLPLTFAEIRIKGKAAVQPLMEKRLFAFREDTHWKMMTLCALYRDAAAFIDALGTIHFWELRVRRFCHCHYTEVLWQGWEPCSIFGVASPKRSWRTAEVKLKAWWWEEIMRLLLPGWKWKFESSGHWRYTEGNELGLGIGRWGLQIKPPLRLHQKFQQCGTPTACACAIQCFVSLKYPMFVNFQNSNLKLHVWLIFKTARRAI